MDISPNTKILEQLVERHDNYIYNESENLFRKLIIEKLESYLHVPGMGCNMEKLKTKKFKDSNIYMGNDQWKYLPIDKLLEFYTCVIMYISRSRG